MVEYLWDGEMDCGWEDLGEKVVDISSKFVDNLLDLMPFSYNEEAIKLITEESLGRFQNLAKNWLKKYRMDIIANMRIWRTLMITHLS